MFFYKYVYSSREDLASAPYCCILSRVIFMTCHPGGQVVPRVPGEAGGHPGWHSPVQAACAERDQRGALLPAVLLRSSGLRQEDGGRIHVSVCWRGLGEGLEGNLQPPQLQYPLTTLFGFLHQQEVAPPQQCPVGHGHHAGRCRPLARRGNRRGSWVDLQSLSDPAGHPRTQPRHHQRPGGRSSQNSCQHLPSCYKADLGINTWKWNMLSSLALLLTE